MPTNQYRFRHHPTFTDDDPADFIGRVSVSAPESWAEFVDAVENDPVHEGLVATTLAAGGLREPAIVSGSPSTSSQMLRSSVYEVAAAVAAEVPISYVYEDRDA